MTTLEPITRIEQFLADIIDQGGGGGSGGGGMLVVNCDSQTMTLDKTFAEIRDAAFAVINIALQNEKQIGYTTRISAVGGNYNIWAVVFNNDGSVSPALFYASAEDGYPVMST